MQICQFLSLTILLGVHPDTVRVQQHPGASWHHIHLLESTVDEKKPEPPRIHKAL